MMRITLYRYFGFHGFLSMWLPWMALHFGVHGLFFLFAFWKSSTAQRMPFQMLIIQMLPPPSSLQSLSHFLPIESSPIILSVLIAFNHVHTFRKKEKNDKQKVSSLFIERAMHCMQSQANKEEKDEQVAPHCIALIHQLSFLSKT